MANNDGWGCTVTDEQRHLDGESNKQMEYSEFKIRCFTNRCISFDCEKDSLLIQKLLGLLSYNKVQIYLHCHSVSYQLLRWIKIPYGAYN